MTKIITIANSKGGVGKTTTAVFIATCLSGMGYKVLLKDSDPQGSSTEWIEDLENVPFSFELTNQRNMGKTKNYDFVIIDTPPQNSDIIKSAIDVSNLIIIPTEASGLDLSRVFSLFDSADEEKIYKVLMTKVMSNTNSFKYTRALLDEEKIDHFDTYIPRRENIKNSFGKIPGKNDLSEYLELANEIIGVLEI